MTRPMDYTRMNDAKRRGRGQAEGLSDAKAQAVIRLVGEQHEATRITAALRQLARDVVREYKGDDAYLLALQSEHRGKSKWMPGPSATRAILKIVGYGFETNAA
jgi:hypothetical protein